MAFANKLINMLLMGCFALAIVACDREPREPAPESNPYLGLIPLKSLELPAGDPAPGSRFSIQIGLYDNMRDAAPAIEALSKNDYLLMVNRVVNEQNSELNLLRVGEYASLEEASAASEELQKIVGDQTKIILLP